MLQAQKLELSLISASNFISKKASEIQQKIYPDNLSSEHGYIVSYLCMNEDKDIFQRDIQKEFNLERSTVSTVLKELEKEGLVERKSVINDARLKKVTATRGAKIINDACNKELENFISSYFNDIEEDDLNTFSRVLLSLNQKTKTPQER